MVEFLEYANTPEGEAQVNIFELLTQDVNRAEFYTKQEKFHEMKAEVNKVAEGNIQ